MANEIIMKKGEGKQIQFTATQNNLAVDLSSATFFFGVKSDYDDTSYLIQKTNSDFNILQASSGIISVIITASDSNIAAGCYLSELKITFTTNTNIDKSTTIPFVIEESVT